MTIQKNWQELIRPNKLQVTPGHDATRYATLVAERSAANAATPIFWGHGTADPVVVLQRGVASRDTLQALGYAVEWHTYPMAHAVCAEEITDLRLWLGQRLG